MVSCDGKLGVIFDFDGVLVDSGWAHRQAWYDLAEAEGLTMSDEFFSATFGMQNDTILPMLRPAITAGEVTRLSDWKEQRYRDLVQRRPEPAEGVMALLDDLRAKGFKVAIGSSAPGANVAVFSEALQLDRYVDARVTKEHVSEGKPSPQTFLKAAEALSLPPVSCCVVEDAVHGVEAGKAGGMRVVAVTTTRTREELSLADRVVDSLAELAAEDFVTLLGEET
jgi:HAD superfamily hydrolase (TIGR01509 family)